MKNTVGHKEHHREGERGWEEREKVKAEKKERKCDVSQKGKKRED